MDSIGGNLTDLTILNTIAENWDGKLPAVLGSELSGLLDFRGLLSGGAQEVIQ